MNIAILLAAGVSSRFNSKIHKVLYKINNKPIIKYSTDILCEYLDKIIIVANSTNDKPIHKIFAKNKPSNNAIIAALVKYKSVFIPMRPTDLKSPTLATPTTNTEKTNGAIIIFIKRIKISLKICKLGAKSFQK